MMSPAFSFFLLTVALAYDNILTFRNTLRLNESMGGKCELLFSWNAFSRNSTLDYEYNLEVKEHGL